MVEGRLRSRTYRRVPRKVAGRVSMQYRRRKPKQARCAETGKVLHGIPRELPYKMKNMPKTKKRPSRPFGGVLSSSAMRKIIVNKILKQSK